MSQATLFRRMQCVVVCRSVSQCVAVCRSTSQCIAVCNSVSQCVAVCHSVVVWPQIANALIYFVQGALYFGGCRVLQSVAVCWSVLLCGIVWPQMRRHHPTLYRVAKTHKFFLFCNSLRKPALIYRSLLRKVSFKENETCASTPHQWNSETHEKESAPGLERDSKQARERERRRKEGRMVHFWGAFCGHVLFVHFGLSWLDHRDVVVKLNVGWLAVVVWMWSSCFGCALFVVRCRVVQGGAVWCCGLLCVAVCSLVRGGGFREMCLCVLVRSQRLCWRGAVCVCVTVVVLMCVRVCCFARKKGIVRWWFSKLVGWLWLCWCGAVSLFCVTTLRVAGCCSTSQCAAVYRRARQRLAVHGSVLVFWQWLIWSGKVLFWFVLLFGGWSRGRGWCLVWCVAYLYAGSTQFSPPLQTAYAKQYVNTREEWEGGGQEPRL